MKSWLSKILPFLQNPFVLAIVPTVVITMLVPMKRDRYLLEQESMQVMSQDRYIWYDDLTGDGAPEAIIFDQQPNNSSLNIRDTMFSLFNQWNFYGEFKFGQAGSLFLAFDHNDNGQKELFVFTVSNDSVFLHAIFDYIGGGFAIEKRFLAKVGPGRRTPDPYMIWAEPEDLNGDGKKELMFVISTGFSLYPRNVFAYFIDADSLIVSPESYFGLSSILLADLTGDGRREILLQGYAPSNIRDEDVRYHDHSCWLMVLDQNLAFMFEPVEFPGKFSGVSVQVVENAGKKEILVFHTTSNPDVDPRAYYFDMEGRLLRAKDMPGMPFQFVRKLHHEGTDVFVFSSADHSLKAYDMEMNIISTYDLGTNMFHSYSYHANQGRRTKQLLFLVGQESGSLYAFVDLFRHPLRVPVDWREGSQPCVSFIDQHNSFPLLSLQVGQNHYLFRFTPNPRYYLNFGMYFLIYAGVLAFTFLTRSAQRRQIAKQRETEKRIAELQINLVKNKLDPHFSINALNSVIQAIRDDRRDVAEDGLLQFVGMYRNMLLSADSVDRSLDEELAFTESYLKLEKLRYDAVFDYSIEVARGVDHATLVPKMVVQLHAENAVKHGLAPLGQGGRLHIGVSSSEVGLQIAIADNGIGFSRGVEASGQRRSQGLKLMQEFYHLYPKISGRMIQSHIEELSDAQGEPAGTRVTIIIREKS